MKAPTRIRDAFLTVALQPRNLAKKLSRVMPGAGMQGVTVMAVDGQWLKLLQVEGRRITKLLACPVQGSSVDEIHQTFTEACATEGAVVKEVLVANPTHLCTVRLFSLPSTDPKEIRDIVELQAEKHTPYAKEEILSDFSVIDRSQSGYSRVLLVIVHQDVVHRAVQLVEKSQLTLDRVGCELEGLVSWYRAGKKGSAGQGPSLIVDVDGYTTTLLVMQRGQPHFYRTLATGMDHLESDPAQASQRLVGELHRSIEALEAEGGVVGIQELILTGRVERLGELKAVMEREMEMAVNLVSPWQGLTITESTRAASARLPSLSFAGLVGLALAPGEIDLTPHTFKLRQAFEARGRALVMFGCQCVTALILISGLIIGRVQKSHQQYTALRQLYEETAPESLPVQVALEHMKFVDNRLRDRGQFLEMADTVAQLTLPEIKWVSLTYTAGEALVLKGTSDKLPKVYEFVAALERLPDFEEVEARRVARRTVDDRDVTDFEIRCSLATETAIR